MKIKLSYWSANILIVIFLLSIWFLSSFGAGILFTEYLDKFQIGGFKLGFWFSQQGAPKAKLALEKPQGKTIRYDELIKSWTDNP